MVEYLVDPTMCGEEVNQIKIFCRKSLKQLFAKSKKDQSTDQRPYNGFMDPIKHRSSIACLSVQKYNIAYIDNEDMHHFFHSRSMFEIYEKINITDVGVASGISKRVGK